MIDPMLANNFRSTVLDFYSEHGRGTLPWRQPEPGGSFDAYKIMVSELMLQQTQVNRVVGKYTEFLTTFPTLESLAAADIGNVLRVWSGLGYNRRAKFLHQAAKQVVASGQTQLPADTSELVKLPGVGKNTAGAIAAYAWNKPVVFVETNIRTVYIHHFFADEADIPDKAITELVEQTLLDDDARIWYWALMDYGSYLKKTVGNLSQASKMYAKQSKFEGSKRQIRGAIIRELAAATQPRAVLEQRLNDKRFDAVVDELIAEGLIQLRGDILSL